ncbi:NUDIX domain-containing protein [Epidermidibacterium keratini]|uniref:NUDIX domain-containing protein n=1 Tax=Epidermidibacterium keratini TaxID=1891644 RepID=A0A7L4YTE1_9ACTN|nr:NUDIX hydrolase [Epidermidibacterium keratini]QHC01797.1 NUDIX domain-containing protein [Epidermidibacterium keratini]
MSSRSTDLVAAGGVVWRNGPSGPLVLLVHRPKYDDWSLPKGKAERGENVVLTAMREVVEETGLPVRIGARLGTIEYDVKNRRKIVHYWSMPLVDDNDLEPAADDIDEVDEFAWLSPSRARRALTYADDVEILNRWEKVGTSRISLLLVRHGRAGSRSEWAGPDRSRPLDERGVAQSDAIAQTLPAFGPTTVYSARPERCRQTVEPLAAVLGVPVRSADALSDNDFEERPERTIEAIRALICAPSPVVACSQGTTIEQALSAVVPAKLGPFESKKGSVWAIGVRDGRIVVADYYPSLLPED